MTDVGRNETVRLEDDPQSETFENHSAFARISHSWLSSDVPVGHQSSHDRSLKTMPTPYDRTSQDDVDRTQDDLMIQLAGEVDAYCLDIVLAASTIDVADVEAADLEAWLRRSILDIHLSTRSNCGIDIVFDGELEPLISTVPKEGPRAFDAGWERANVYGMNRHRPVETGLYVVVNLQHVIGLSSRGSLFYTSHVLDADSEYLSARCDLAYRPRLDFHPGAVRIARVTFADEDAWKAAAREAAGV